MLLEIFDPKAPARAVGIDLGTTNSLVATVRSGLAVVISDGQLNAGGPAIHRCGLRTGVKIGDLCPEAGHQPWAELVGFGHVAKQRLLREAAHHHHPIQRRAQAIEAQHPVATAVDRTHLQIQVRRSATVQA